MNLLDVLQLLHWLGLLQYLAAAVAITWGFFLMYAIYVVAYEHWKEMPLESRIALGAIVIIGLPVDFLFNMTFGTVLFLELPRWELRRGWRAFFRSETLFTGRVSRWEKLGGRRAALARRICKNLNALQPSHC